MRVSEKVLLALSRHSTQREGPGDSTDWGLDNALSLLVRVYPPFISEISGRSVLDFGCGFGWQAVAMSRAGAKRVVGIDSDFGSLAKARALVRSSDAVEFHQTLSPDLYDQFDYVISQNSMEHFPDPVGIVGQMKKALKSDGKLLITFGPPWLSPYGSHMYFFTKVPWVNILFSEHAVMQVRRRFRDDRATRYEDVEKGLNKMTLAKFDWIVNTCGFRPVYQKLECVKRMNWLSKIPIGRELFVNHVTYLCIK